MGTATLAALAMVALEVLSVDGQGRVWRHRDGDTEIEKRRADTGRSAKDGYLRVQFTIGSTRFTVPAHQLVWIVANRRLLPDSMEVNHRDGNKQNNAPANLEAVPRSFNAAHALHKLGKLAMRNHPGAKLTPKQVLEIRELRRSKAMTQAAIAQLYGVTTKTVRNVESRAKWTELFAAE